MSRTIVRTAEIEESIQDIARHLSPHNRPGSSNDLKEHMAAVRMVEKYANGGVVLDFGSGRCIKAALLAQRGFRVFACDDLRDPWHDGLGQRKEIIAFARQWGVDFFHIGSSAALPYRPRQFDIITIHHVLEHFPSSPREILCQLLEYLKPHGILLITVPNAANLRKRLALLLGRTNYPSFDDYFLQPAPWRGHFREYVLGDLFRMARHLGLEIIDLTGVHMLAYVALRSRLLQHAYCGMMSVLPVSLRDSLLLVARKTPGAES